MMGAAEAAVLRRGEGRVIPRPGTRGHVTIKVSSESSTVFETQRPAGDAGGASLHAHPGFDETFYVVAGEWEFVLDDRMIVADEGTVVHVPRGVFHGFHSTGRAGGKLVGIAVPGGIEHFFEEAARTADDDGAGRITASSS